MVSDGYAAMRGDRTMLEKVPESVGQALIHQRAGMENVVYNHLYHVRRTERIELYSAAFGFNSRIPVRYTADGEGVSPPVSWRGAPDGTDSLAMIVEDADSP